MSLIPACVVFIFTYHLFVLVDNKKIFLGKVGRKMFSNVIIVVKFCILMLNRYDAKGLQQKPNIHPTRFMPRKSVKDLA